LSVAVVAVVAVFVALAMVDPDPRGHGTHEQLGLEPCGWPVLYGVPCPTCGVTTAGSLLLHLRVLTAFETQPFGAVLTLAGFAFVLAALWHMAKRESLIARIAGWRWGWIALAGVALLLASWAWVRARWGVGG